MLRPHFIDYFCKLVCNVPGGLCMTYVCVCVCVCVFECTRAPAALLSEGVGARPHGTVPYRSNRLFIKYFDRRSGKNINSK